MFTQIKWPFKKLFRILVRQNRSFLHKFQTMFLRFVKRHGTPELQRDKVPKLKRKLLCRFDGRCLVMPGRVLRWNISRGYDPFRWVD
jgi:hypothetical protein